MPHLSRLLLAAALATSLLSGRVAGLSIDDFLGGRPLNKERIATDLLQYYQRDHPMGIPVLDVPDPLLIPKNVTVSGLSVYTPEVAGLSSFRLEYVNVNVTSLTVSVLVRLANLQVLSAYEMVGGYFSSGVSGDLNCTLVNLDVKIDLEMGPGYDRKMEVQDLQATVTKEEFLLYFSETNLAISAIVATADTFFDTIVSSALGRRIDAVKDKLNGRLAERFKNKYFPEGINPVDLLLVGVKKDMMAKYEPFVVGDKTVNLPAGITLVLTDITVTGLSSLHRTHEVSVQFIDDRVLAIIQLGCQAVSVSVDVEASLSVLPALSSRLEFSIDSVEVWVEVQQPADVTHPPYLRRLHITLGNFRLVSSGDSSFSYLLEAGVNGLANGLRRVIISRLEPRLQQVIQQRLNALDVEAIIKKRLKL